MTPQEFRGWFEGFTESMDENERPTLKQWEKIKKRVKEIYFPYSFSYTGPYYYYPIYPTYTVQSLTNCSQANNLVTTMSVPNTIGFCGGVNSINQDYMSVSAMYTTGKSDFSTIC